MTTMTAYRFRRSLEQAQRNTGHDFSEAVQALRDGGCPAKLLEAQAAELESTDRMTSMWLDHLTFAMRNA